MNARQPPVWESGRGTKTGVRLGVDACPRRSSGPPARRSTGSRVPERSPLVGLRGCACPAHPSCPPRQTPALPPRGSRAVDLRAASRGEAVRLGVAERSTSKTPAPRSKMAAVDTRNDSSPSFHDRRPVTPEVAGSSPVAPVKFLQTGIFCWLTWRKRPPASLHPALIPHRK
jgi:hypothetical protein